MDKPETVTFKKTVPIADADDVPIKEGSVLRDIETGESGVVVNIFREGDIGYMFECIGDVKIKISHGVTRVTNRYRQFRHVPRSEQTYQQRLWSWLQEEFWYDEDLNRSRDEQLAMEGILALLPYDLFDDDFGDLPHSTEEALSYLVSHLTELSESKSNPEPIDPLSIENLPRIQAAEKRAKENPPNILIR